MGTRIVVDIMVLTGQSRNAPRPESVHLGALRHAEFCTLCAMGRVDRRGGIAWQRGLSESADTSDHEARKRRRQYPRAKRSDGLRGLHGPARIP